MIKYTQTKSIDFLKRAHYIHAALPLKQFSIYKLNTIKYSIVEKIKLWQS